MMVVMQKPQNHQIMQMAHQGKLPNEKEEEEAKKAPRLEKQKFLKAFKLANDLQMKQMKEMFA